jgi:hypothetical protein
MEFAQEAMVERDHGNFARAYLLATQALPLELDAARQIEKTVEAEPTRSILYLSAATLAYQSNNRQLAKQLIGEASSGFPPPQVEHDLFELLENLGAELRVTDEEESLVGSQIRLSISGGTVGNGSAPYQPVEDRMRAMVKLLDRTALNMQGYQYQSGAKVGTRNRAFTPYIHTPTPGSFQVIIELAPREDAPSALFVTGESVVDRVVTGVHLVQDGNLDELRDILQDDAFYPNFVASAQLLAPDGKVVERVELASPRREVALTKTREEIVIPPSSFPAPSKDNFLTATATLRGLLIEASIKNDRWVSLKTETGSPKRLWINEAIDDLVRTYFDRHVEVHIQTRAGRPEIVNFYPVEE